MSLLEVDDLSIEFGGLKAVDNVGFKVCAGEVVSVIDPNGAGKTTRFNMISGLYAPANGAIRLDGENVTSLAPHRLAARGLSRTFQNRQVFLNMTVCENVMARHHLLEKASIVADLLGLPSSARCNRKTRASAMALLDRVGLAPIAEIASHGIAVLLVERDMKLVMKISNHIVVLDHGEKIAEGMPAIVSRNPRVIEAYLGTRHTQAAGRADG